MQVKVTHDISKFRIPPGFEKVHEECKEDTTNGADVLAADADTWPEVEPPPVSSDVRSTDAGTTTPVPTIPRHAWTQTEIKAAAGLLADADWPVFGEDTDIYQTAHKAAYKEISRDSIVPEARILQLALMMSRRHEHFGRLNQLIQEGGLKGMATSIKASYHDVQHTETYFEKTAGDMLQSFWCRKHLPNMIDDFMVNKTQAEIACWLQLPQLVLDKDTAKELDWWNVHHVADFQEQVALYLPTKLLASYMNIFTSYHQLFIKDDNAVQICERRDARGLWNCPRQVKPYYVRFCCETHWKESSNPMVTRELLSR